MMNLRDEKAYMYLRLVDQELSAKIASELQMEQEIRDSEKLPANISDYLDSSSFEVIRPTQYIQYPLHSDRKLT